MNLTEEQIANLRAKYKQWVEKEREARATMVQMPLPRYDEVYFSGLASLDECASTDELAREDEDDRQT